MSDEPADPTDPTQPLDPLDSLDPLDLGEVERELAGVEVALERLDTGSYWTDEVTGETLADEVLERDPIARRTP